mgnify:CR=1 FL=1
MKNSKDKDFKAVEFMRKRRDELSNAYNSNPKSFLKTLEQIRKNYQSKFHKLEKHTA